MVRWPARIVLVIALGCCRVAAAQELPAIPQSLLGATGVVCMKLSQAGTVSDAFIVTSTGDAARDRDLLMWARQLQWGAAKAGEKRDVWFPMPVAIGDVRPPAMPASCGPTAGKEKT